jgi:hypothetical protein
MRYGRRFSGWTAPPPPAGHNRTATTELVYRHELRPVITTGAEVMDRILNSHG